MSSSPSRSQKSAARAVMYKKSRLRSITENYKSIDVLMQLADTSTGDAPVWTIPATGAVSPAIIEAANRCKQIGTSMQAIAHELKDVDIPDDDRKNLVAAFNAQAAAWTTRGNAWAAPNGNGAIAAIAVIAGHEKDARDAVKQVKSYMQTNEQLDVGSN